MLHIQVQLVNATEGYTFYKTPIDKTIYEENEKGELYRALVSEYGRCVSKVYVDTKEGKRIQVGWCFQKRMKYDDCKDTFLGETWVSVYTKPDTVSVEHHYAKLGTI